MPKSFSIFIQLILMIKIVLSSEWKTIIEIENFESTSRHDPNLKIFFTLSNLGTPPLMKIQSKSKLNNLLIFLSNDKFKYCILPYLSAQNFITIYLYFQNLVPELNFQKFLPPSRFYTINNVLDISQEPTTFLQPLEINLLYQFEGEYSSLKPNILYFTKNQIPNIFRSHFSINPDSIFACLSQNKIIPYETYDTLTSHQKLLILKNKEVDYFFVTFEKSKGQFINIAKGRGVAEIEFYDYVECIWEAYNLQGWKKFYWKIKYFVAMPYDRYLFYVVKIIFYLRSRLFFFF
jgi:hypothetical protein